MCYCLYLFINLALHKYTLFHMQVACPFRKGGCEFIGQLQMLKSHKKKCDFNPENLPSFLKEESSGLKTTPGLVFS